MKMRTQGVGGLGLGDVFLKTGEGEWDWDGKQSVGRMGGAWLLDYIIYQIKIKIIGRSQCVLVSPAGPGRRLQVSASGSEHPGPQHSVSRMCKRPGMHPEESWEDTACSSVSIPTELRFQS